MLIGFAVRYREQTVAVQFGLHGDAQALGGPYGEGCVAQAGLFHGRGARYVEARGQPLDFIRQWPEESFLGKLAVPRQGSGAQIASIAPCGGVAFNSLQRSRREP